MRESIIDADRTKREKAKKLRYKKPIVKELNLMTIQMELSDIQEACVIIPDHFEPLNRILRATIPERESQLKSMILLSVDYLQEHYL